MAPHFADDLGLSVRQVFLNGVFMPAEEAKVSVLDRGYLFGDGVYEVMPVYDGCAFELEAHLTRLDASLAGIALANPYSHAQWRDLLNQLIARHGGGNQSIYWQVTRGTAPRDHVFPATVVPAVLMMSNPLKPIASEVHSHGIQAVTLNDIRWQQCQIKSIALLANVLLKQQAQEQGAQEALLIRDGYLTEGAASNAFVVRDGVLHTAPKGPHILAGITRAVVIALAHELGLTVNEQAVPEADLAGADEIWVTSSTKEILPVTQLNQQPIGTGMPGPIWHQLHAAFQAYKQRVLAA